MGHSLAGPATSPAAPRQRGVCLCSRAMAAGRRPPRSRTRLSGDRRDRAAASRPERSSVAQQRGTVTSGQVVALLEFFERFKRGVSTCAQPPTSSFDAGHNSWNGDHSRTSTDHDFSGPRRWISNPNLRSYGAGLYSTSPTISVDRHTSDGTVRRGRNDDVRVSASPVGGLGVPTSDSVGRLKRARRCALLRGCVLRLVIRPPTVDLFLYVL